MAKQVQVICDVCKKPTARIVGKLFLSPLISGVTTKRSAHTNYSHHCDVGICCFERLKRGFNFRKRLTAAEYGKARKAGTG